VSNQSGMAGVAAGYADVTVIGANVQNSSCTLF
jgi:hypothetical protein